jgi:phosphoglycerol transferase MdoB-like AlkP superfamily enzyme
VKASRIRRSVFKVFAPVSFIFPFLFISSLFFFSHSHISSFLSVISFFPSFISFLCPLIFYLYLSVFIFLVPLPTFRRSLLVTIHSSQLRLAGMPMGPSVLES